MAQGISQKVQRAASTVGLFTLCSRLLGFARDILIAAFLGAGFYSDAFFVAFRIPNLFRRLFGEGSLTVAFVPIFTSELEKHGAVAAKRFMRSAFTWLFFILLAILIIGEIFAEPIAWMFAAGFEAEKLALTVQLLRVVFPYVLLICLVALSMGVLNSLKHFATPAASPVLLNLAMIVALLVSPLVSLPVVYLLAFGVLVGGFLQFGVQIWVMHRKDFAYGFEFAKPSAELRKLAAMMFPSIFGAAAYQINLLINTQLASRLGEGSVSYIYYADRLVEFPLGVVAVAMGTAILPFVSSQVAQEQWSDLKATLCDGLKMLYLLILPALVGLLVLRRPIVSLLFERREFGSYETDMTAYALLFATFGMFGVATVRVVAPIFFAMKDMWTPFKVSMVVVVVNLIVALSTMASLKHGGLTLAVSVAATINALLLLVILRRRLGPLGLRGLVSPVLRMSIAAVAMGAGLWAILLFFGWSDGLPANRIAALAVLAALIFVAALFYFLFCHLLRLQEVAAVLRKLKSKLITR